MSDVDIHDRVEELEARSEALDEIITSCRKWILLAQAAIAAGLMALAASLAGLVWLDLPRTLLALAAMLGGTVLAGSNWSTLRKSQDEKTAIERLRIRIIDEAGLPRVAGGEKLGAPYLEEGSRK